MQGGVVCILKKETSVACYFKCYFQCLQIRCVYNFSLSFEFDNSMATMCFQYVNMLMWVFHLNSLQTFHKVQNKIFYMQKTENDCFLSALEKKKFIKLKDQYCVFYCPIIRHLVLSGSRMVYQRLTIVPMFMIKKEHVSHCNNKVHLCFNSLGLWHIRITFLCNIFQWK